jgi:hypothetical protein
MSSSFQYILLISQVSLSKYLPIVLKFRKNKQERVHFAIAKCVFVNNIFALCNNLVRILTMVRILSVES